MNEHPAVSPAADPLAAAPSPHATTPQASRLDAALLDAARALRAERDRDPEAGDEVVAMRVRADALLARAHAAARAGDAYLAFDCVQQIERELVLATTEEERAARLPALVLESRARLQPWRAAVADRLADAAPTVATLRALLANLHEAAQEARYRRLLVDRQLPVAIGIAAATAVLYFAWSLVGGFDWLTNENYEITTAMWLVTGALFGLFGSVLSMLFGVLRGARDGTRDGALPDLRHLRLVTAARPLVGLLAALPIVLLLEAGFLNLGEPTPALVFSLCFAAGFAERWFVARLLRGRSEMQ